MNPGRMEEGKAMPNEKENGIIYLDFKLVNNKIIV